jgi:Ca-activated chloride channel family protein
MRFAHPEILYWLWVVFPLAALFWALNRRRLRRYEAFAQGALFGKLAGPFRPSAYQVKQALLLCFYVFTILALARPQWGYEMREVKREGLDILIVLDTSRSMLAADVKPDRLERAKLAIRDFLKDLHGDRVGLVAFAGDAFLVCPMTVDYRGFLLSLDDVDTRTIPRGGTNIGKALETAITQYTGIPSKYKAVILITDGENLEGDPAPIIKEARKAGIKIYCVGIGTREGDLIKAKVLGQNTYVKDENGNIVKSRLNEPLLQTIALKTGGIYVRAGAAEFGLDVIYKQLAKLDKREVDGQLSKKYFERFQLPLGLALLFLLLELWWPLAGNNNRSEGA